MNAHTPFSGTSTAKHSKPPRQPLLEQVLHSFVECNASPEPNMDLVTFSAGQLKNRIETLLEWSRDTDEKPPAIAFRAVPGTGKTHNTIEGVAGNVGRIDGVVLHLVLDHKLADEAARAYSKNGVETMTWFGKSQKAACMRHEVAADIMKIGLKTTELCESRDEAGEMVQCPYFAQCGYQKQKKRKKYPDVVIAPLEYLRGGGLPEALEEQIALVIIDEAFADVLVREGQVKTTQLGVPFSEALLDAGNHQQQYETLTAVKTLIVEALIRKEDPIDRLIEEQRRETPGKSDEDYLNDIYKLITKDILGLRNAELGRRIGVSSWLKKEEVTRRAKQIRDYYLEEIRFWRMLEEAVSSRIAGDKDRYGMAYQSITTNDGRRSEYVAFAQRILFRYHAPILILDASSDERITHQLLDDTHNVAWLDFRKPVDPIYRVLITGHGLAKSNLVGSVTSQKREESQRKARAVVEATLSRISEHEGERSILLVGSKSVIEALKHGDFGRDFMKKHDPATAHFGGLRGLNKFENVDTVVILGKFELEERVAQRKAAALSQNPTEKLGCPTVMKKTPVTVGLHDPRDLQPKFVRVDTRRFTDPEMAAVQYLAREEEILQAEQRLRSIRRHGEDVRSYIIGNAIPDAMVFDEIYSYRDFMNSGDADEHEDPLVAVKEAFNGVICAKAWDVYRGVGTASVGDEKGSEGARIVLKNRGFSAKGAPAGWVVMTIKKVKKGAQPRTIYVSSSLAQSMSDLDYVARHHGARVFGWDPALVEPNIKERILARHNMEAANPKPGTGET